MARGVEGYPRRRIVGLAFAGLLAVAAAVGVFAIRYDSRAVLELGGKTFVAEVADTQAEREKGLSGRSPLPPNRAMLFVFSTPDTYCFWMKDMRFNLDMVWLDQDKRVIMVKNNVSPNTYPASFCPDKPARYVVEVDAGEAASVHVGDQASIR